MKTKILITVATLLVAMTHVESNAQIVSLINGEVVLDCSGVPNTWTTDEFKAVTHFDGGQLKRHLSDKAWDGESLSANGNVKVSSKFTVSDEITTLNAAGETVRLHSWYAATGYGDADTNIFSAASSKNGLCAKHEGGSRGWRMPNQREMMLIYAYHEQLELLGVGEFWPGSVGLSYHWSASERSEAHSCYVNFNAGYMFITTKPVSLAVRCVRDID